MNRLHLKLLNKHELKKIHQSNKSRLYIDIALIYLAIACVLFSLKLGQVFLKIEPLNFLLQIAVFFSLGWLQYCIAQAFHEAIHQKLGYKNMDGFISGILTAYPIGLTPSYCQLHLAHHRYAGDPLFDPDYHTYSYFPPSKIKMLWHFLKKFLVLPAILQFFTMKKREIGKPGHSSSKTKALKENILLIIVQLTILGIFTLAFNPGYYIIFWLLPLVTVVKSMNSIRLLCEHGDPKKTFVYRSFTTPGYILGVFGFNKHGEHHIYEKVPYENLGILFNKLQEHISVKNAQEFNQINEIYEVYDGNHLDLLIQWFRKLPW